MPRHRCCSWPASPPPCSPRSAVWVAAGIAALLGTGSWTAPAWSLGLLPRLFTGGVPALVGPAGSIGGFCAALATLVATAVGAATLGWRRTRPRRNPATRSLLRGHQLGDLTGPAAHDQGERAAAQPHHHRHRGSGSRAIRWGSGSGASTDTTCACPGRTSR